MASGLALGGPEDDAEACWGPGCGVDQAFGDHGSHPATRGGSSTFGRVLPAALGPGSVGSDAIVIGTTGPESERRILVADSWPANSSVAPDEVERCRLRSDLGPFLPCFLWSPDDAILLPFSLAGGGLAAGFAGEVPEVSGPDGPEPDDPPPPPPGPGPPLPPVGGPEFQALPGGRGVGLSVMHL